MWFEKLKIATLQTFFNFIVYFGFYGFILNKTLTIDDYFLIAITDFYINGRKMFQAYLQRRIVELIFNAKTALLAPSQV